MDGVLDSDKAYAADRMIMSNGSQQMLYMVTEALCDEGDIVLVEDPSYFVYLGILQSHGLEGRGIRITQAGIELDHLEATLARLKKTGEIKRVKMLYLVTYYQNPTGVTTSFEKKVAALKLLKQYEKAAGHPIYLLEDAAYRELRFAGEDEKSALAAKGFANRVIYAGTYSKPFATGTRVGFGILPDPVYTAVIRIKGSITIPGRRTCCNNWWAQGRSVRVNTKSTFRRCGGVTRKRRRRCFRRCGNIFRRKFNGGNRRADCISGRGCPKKVLAGKNRNCSSARWRRTCCMCRANCATRTTRRARSRTTKCA